MREITLLREAVTLYGLSYERAGAFVGASGRTIQRWLDKENEPTEIYKKAIIEGVEKMKAEFEPKLKALTKVINGHEVAVWWGNLDRASAGQAGPDDPKPEAVAELEENVAFEERTDQPFLRKIAEAGAKLKASVSGTYEAEFMEKFWPGFVEVAWALHARGIKLEI